MTSLHLTHGQRTTAHLIPHTATQLCGFWGCVRSHTIPAPPHTAPPHPGRLYTRCQGGGGLPISQSRHRPRYRPRWDCQWDCDGTAMAMRWDCDNSPVGAAIHIRRPKSGVGVVGRGVGRAELTCDCSPAATRRKPNATAAASEVGVMQLELQLQLQLQLRYRAGGWRGWSLVVKWSAWS
jgi:hypothetical protein